ncbi:hypothetical protein CDL12_02330 [Handroanthus impetiginosus]|uniref:DUF4228 domain-containing protein n=1 Tax=Handroanthus impetiginosus TaxID=429701 RepID=A0A2G9I5A5_9LAMI|nr:hypothetical protein CDL12_02330 [Handroanthus impetiginosus]
MGNCQAVDAAALVIQHPNGKQERMYWPVAASEVMKMNPGHYVSLIIPLPISDGEQQNPDEKKTVRFTRVKLLRPTDTLVLGRAYRLVTTQEVMKVLRAKKHAKMKRNYQSESGENLQTSSKKESTCSESAVEKKNQATKESRHKQRSGSTNLAAGKPKSWRPSLQSISESAS